MRVKVGFLVVIAMVLLWVGALCAPSHIYKDSDAGLTSLEIRILKTEASERSKIPPVWMQITEAVSRASITGDIHNPPLPDAVVVWRGPFGIRTGRTEMRSGDLVRQSFYEEQEIGAWLLLFVLEVALMGLAGFCFAPAIRRHRPKTQ